MNFKKANDLFKEGRYSEAEFIYRSLYKSQPLSIYYRGLNLSLMKQGKSFSFNNDKKILFVTSGLKGPTPGGGIATCFHSMIHTLGNEAGEEVDILYLSHPYYSKENYSFWKEFYFKSCNAKLKFTNVNSKDYGSVEMKRSKAVLDYLIENNGIYKTVVFHDFSGLAYFTLLAKKNCLVLKDVRVVISAHGNHKLSYFFGRKKVSTWSEKATLFMEKRVYEMADEITVPSDYYKNWILCNFSVREEVITVIPNIILKDDGLDEDNNLTVNFKNKSIPTLIFYGRFERLKGLDVFLETVKKLGPKFNILFAGNDTKIDGGSAVEYIKKNLIDFKGEFSLKLNCNSSQIYNYAKKNNAICVFPTLGETSSCVVVECINHGVPFIASAIEPIKELVNYKYHNQVFFKTGCSESLLYKIERGDFYNPDLSFLSFDMGENKKVWVDFLIRKEIEKGVKKQLVCRAYHPLVTVVIPTSDRPDLLSDSLFSVINQSYKNIEIIIVDDNSKESHKNRELAERYNIKYIYLDKKRYKGYACNIGADAAVGDYICFFDDDDVAHPEMIQNYINSFYLNENVDIFSGFAACFEHGSYIKTKKIEPEYTSLALGGGVFVNLHINFFGKGTFIIKKDKFQKVGGYEVDDDSVPMVDYRFYIKSALNGLNIDIVPLVQYFYRKNSPRSLFYLNKDRRDMHFLAKKSIDNIIKDKLGSDVGGAFSSFVWDISLPVYN